MFHFMEAVKQNTLVESLESTCNAPWLFEGRTLSNLRALDLSQSGVESLPSKFSGLRNLTHLRSEQFDPGPLRQADALSIVAGMTGLRELHAGRPVHWAASRLPLATSAICACSI